MKLVFESDELKELYPVGAQPKSARYQKVDIAGIVEKEKLLRSSEHSVASVVRSFFNSPNKIYKLEKPAPFESKGATPEVLQKAFLENPFLHYLFSNDLGQLAESGTMLRLKQNEVAEGLKLFLLAVPYVANHNSSSHEYFYGGIYSNWHSLQAADADGVVEQLIVDGYPLRSSEQLYMWLKAKHFGKHQEANDIMASKTPFVAKTIGRSIQIDLDEWHHVSYSYMLQALFVKFNHPHFNRILQNSFNNKNRYLIEASPVDSIWGIGLGARNALLTPARFFPGQNKLGHALMETREHFFGKKEIAQTPFTSLFDYQQGDSP